MSHLELQRGTRCFVTRRKTEFLSSCGGNLWVPLELRQGTRDSSHVAAGESGLIQMEVGKSGLFLSCGGKLRVSGCDGDLRVPLKLQQGRQAFSQVEVGNLGFLSICHRGVGPPLVAGSKSGFLSSSSRGIGPPFTLQQGSQSSSRVGAGNRSSRVATGISVFLSICNRGVRPPLELRQETWPSSQEVTGISGLQLTCNR